MAQQILLTNRSVEAIEPPAEGRIEFKDTRTPGLYLRVTANGVKTFSYVGRAKGSNRVERATLGKYPAVKPEEARAQAVAIAGRLAGGVSVAATLRDRRGELTLNELRALYEAHLPAPKPGRPKRDDSAWRLYIEPAFGNKRLSNIAAKDVEKWHRALPETVVKARARRAAERAAAAEARRREIELRQADRRRGPDPKPRVVKDTSHRFNGKRMANVALAELRAMFNWAANPLRGHFSGVNPASGQAAFASVERERFLQPDELKPFFDALAAEANETMRDFMLVALLTAARRSNVAAMAWADVNLGRAEWRVPGELMKNGQPQTITLSPEAVLILQNRRPASGKGFVFPSKRSKKKGHIVEPRRAWRRVLEVAGIDDLRIHDLRRTLGSWQARTGASLLLIGKSHNHKDPQSTQIYARLDLDPVRQSVERATAAMFEAAAVKPTAEVIDLAGAKSGRPAKSGKVKKVAGS